MAAAYMPPAFSVYAHLAEQKAKTPVTGVAVTISRPQAGGTEEILGTLSIPELTSPAGGWPTLSMLFAANEESLVRTVTAFGLTVTSESDLLRVEKEKLAAMKDPPQPFYKTDRTMSLKRARNTYAWVHGSTDGSRAVWVEKESFLPLKITAPCPSAASSFGWAKAGENKCELEFRNLYALRRGNYQSTRLTLWKDGTPLLFLSFDKLQTGKVKLPPPDEKLSADVKEVAETILH
jgi:hypothetical protein